MAILAIGWESGCLVIRIGSVVIIRLVTGITVRRCTAIPIGVAVQAGQHCMSTGQREVRLVMIESGWRPGIGIMALRTIVTEIIDHVIRIHNPVKILLMA